MRKRHYWKRAFLIGFSVSLFFEITQLTGIYGLYNCPYRTFNVDDLMLNSAGTLAGFIIAPVLLALFPSKTSVLAKKEKIRKQNIVLPIPQLLAVFIDFLLIKVSWSVTVGFFISSTFIEITYKTIGLFVVLFIVPVLWKGKTVGSRLLRYQLINTSGSNPLWSSLLKRFFALYLPWVMYKCLKAITQTELEIESPFYVFHLWLGLASMLGLLILVIVLFIHALIVIMKKGQRPFYFDDVANLLPRNSKLLR